MSDALGRASKGDAPSRGWLAAIGHRMRGGARFMGDWWMNEDDELLGSLTAESADELASQLMSATPDEIAAEADVPSGWVEQRLRCDIPKLSLTLRSPRQRTATAGMHLGLASPRSRSRRAPTRRTASRCAPPPSTPPPPPPSQTTVARPPKRRRGVAAATSFADSGIGGASSALSSCSRWWWRRRGRPRRRPHERRDEATSARARGLTRVAAGLDRAGAAHRRPRRRRRYRRRAAAAVGAVHVPPTALPLLAKNVVKTKTGDAERIPLLPGVAALTAPEDEKGASIGAGGAFARLFGGEKGGAGAGGEGGAGRTVALHHGVDEKALAEGLDVAIGEAPLARRIVLAVVHPSVEVEVRSCR